jgi:hypothetical protein
VEVIWPRFKERSENGTSWFDQLNKNNLYGFVGWLKDNHVWL